MRKWFLIMAATLAATAGRTAEELSFRGEIKVVDLESSFVVVKARNGEVWTEHRFKIVTTTEIASRVSSEGEAERAEATPIVLSELERGDSVVVRYELINGKNVALRIEKTGAQQA